MQEEKSAEEAGVEEAGEKAKAAAPGGKKNDSEKAPLALVPVVALVEEAKAFGAGQRKYGTWNYMRGLSALRLLSACLRHVYAYLSGEKLDPETGIHHLGLARAELGMCMQLEAEGKLEDDRYAYSAPVDMLMPAKQTSARTLEAGTQKEFRLEVGKWYVSRRGDVIGPLFATEESDVRSVRYPFTDSFRTWRPNGKVVGETRNHGEDLMREATPEEVSRGQ